MSTTEYFLSHPSGSAIVGPYDRAEVALHVEDGTEATVRSAPAEHLKGRRMGARHAEHEVTCTEPSCGIGPFLTTTPERRQ